MYRHGRLCLQCTVPGKLSSISWACSNFPLRHHEYRAFHIGLCEEPASRNYGLDDDILIFWILHVRAADSLQFDGTNYQNGSLHDAHDTLRDHQQRDIHKRSDIRSITGLRIGVGWNWHPFHYINSSNV